LKGRQLAGVKFRRQHPVGPFVLDFYCPERKLVVELDGAVHDAQLDRDNARTDQLADYGYRVLRFRNEDVFTNLDSVVRQILEAAEEV
jgi:very-short-patch-repair endonuclease